MSSTSITQSLLNLNLAYAGLKFDILQMESGNLPGAPKNNVAGVSNEVSTGQYVIGVQKRFEKLSTMINTLKEIHTQNNLSNEVVRLYNKIKNLTDRVKALPVKVFNFLVLQKLNELSQGYCETKLQLRQVEVKCSNGGFSDQVVQQSIILLMDKHKKCSSNSQQLVDWATEQSDKFEPKIKEHLHFNNILNATTLLRKFEKLGTKISHILPAFENLRKLAAIRIAATAAMQACNNNLSGPLALAQLEEFKKLQESLGLDQSGKEEEEVPFPQLGNLSLYTDSNQNEGAHIVLSQNLVDPNNNAVDCKTAAQNTPFSKAEDIIKKIEDALHRAEDLKLFAKNAKSDAIIQVLEENLPKDTIDEINAAMIKRIANKIGEKFGLAHWDKKYGLYHAAEHMELLKQVIEEIVK